MNWYGISQAYHLGKQLRKVLCGSIKYRISQGQIDVVPTFGRIQESKVSYRQLVIHILGIAKDSKQS